MNKEIPDVQADYISTLTSEQLISQTTFQMILDGGSSYEVERLATLCQIRCKECGITSRQFDKLFKAYKIQVANSRCVSKGNKTKFIDQPIELNCGEWICDVSGVKKDFFSGDRIEVKYASPIPVLVTEILKNIDDDTEKIKLAYFKEGWKSLICNRSTTASNTKIIELADKGIEVNSDNAKLLVKYISDLVSLNLEGLPKHNAISRLGWVDNEFMPYNEDIKFDGEKENKYLFDAVCQRGDFTEWTTYIEPLRKNIYLRLQMAASFASPLIEKVNALPFVLHLWGGTGSGKTVGLMVAMSIWGNPKLGKLTRTLNMTVNSLMATSAFLYNVPFAGDELQTIKQKDESYDKLIIRITEGIDRGRMSYDKNNQVKSWKNSFLFTGEEPCTKSASGGGVKNRVVEIECCHKVIENGNEVVNFITENYGNAGVEFIEGVKTEKDLQEQYSEIFNNILNETDTTDKQAMAMALILLGDKLATKYIFKNEKPLELNDVKEYLCKARDVDASERAYDYIINYIAVNENKFKVSKENEFGEIWGKFDKDYVYINKIIIEKALNSEGYSFDAVKTKWAEKNYLIKNTQGRFLHNTHCNGVKAIYVKLKNHNEITDIEIDDLPFNA